MILACDVHYIGEGVVVDMVDGVSPNVPHGVFLIKKPKLTTPSDCHQPTGLQQNKNASPSLFRPQSPRTDSIILCK